MKLQLNNHNKKNIRPCIRRTYIESDNGPDVWLCTLEKYPYRTQEKQMRLFSSRQPDEETVKAIEEAVNAVIARDLKVTEEYMSMDEAAKIVDLSKLPNDVSETLRIVRIGDYDVCACIGEHVEHTSEIGRFEIISHDYENGRWRVRFKLRKSG